MGPRGVTPAEELREIVGQVKTHLTLAMEWGLEPPAVSRSVLSAPETGPRVLNSLDDVRNVLGECRRCCLWKERSHIVFGEGPPGARLVFVGEAPGREEDLEGRPFVGEAGKLLTKVIEAMGLTRQDVYICNVVKCRPPRNRDPEKEEIATCIPFLRNQIGVIRPEVICTLGNVAAGGLLGREFKITRGRGEWLSYMDIALMPTYHPAYLLRNPSAKRQVWEDVKKIMKRMGLEVKKNG